MAGWVVLRPEVAARLNVSAAVADRVRANYEKHLHSLGDLAADGAGVPEGDGSARDDRADYRRLRTALLADKRAAVVRLQDARKIDDIVLRRVQAQLDAEEVRLTVSPHTDAD